MNAPYKPSFNPQWGVGLGLLRPKVDEEEQQKQDRFRLIRISLTSQANARVKPPVSLPTIGGQAYAFDSQEGYLRIDGELVPRHMKLAL